MASHKCRHAQLLHQPAAKLWVQQICTQVIKQRGVLSIDSQQVLQASMHAQHLRVRLNISNHHDARKAAIWLLVYSQGWAGAAGLEPQVHLQWLVADQPTQVFRAVRVVSDDACRYAMARPTERVHATTEHQSLCLHVKCLFQ